MTFYASDDKLATVGLQGKVDDINRNAVQIARKVAAEGDALVAGNLSLTWAYEPDDPATHDHVRELFDRQLQDQTDAGGVDFWIGETFSYLGEALLFVERAKRTGLPVMVTMCFEQVEPRSYEGDTPAEVATRLADAGAQELPMELRERVGVLDHDLGCERAGLDVAALLHLQEIAPVAEHRAFGQPFQDPLRHRGFPSVSVRAV